ncbi:hypothetical protein Mgra_00005439 [Meloidogyne graminicola]|uniref:Transmembrane protein n=1 Tax=Meloidogyne graminicola TaxID=189291 RepID=A0A8S9ZQ12_9BILA|nr:hypothetical protein Mgra_00005439 [Meloidogyne graminicola]
MFYLAQKIYVIHYIKDDKITSTIFWLISDQKLSLFAISPLSHISQPIFVYKIQTLQICFFFFFLFIVIVLFEQINLDNLKKKINSKIINKKKYLFNYNITFQLNKVKKIEEEEEEEERGFIEPVRLPGLYERPSLFFAKFILKIILN